MHGYLHTSNIRPFTGLSGCKFKIIRKMASLACPDLVYLIGTKVQSDPVPTIYTKLNICLGVQDEAT